MLSKEFSRFLCENSNENSYNLCKFVARIENINFEHCLHTIGSQREWELVRGFGAKENCFIVCKVLCLYSGTVI